MITIFHRILEGVNEVLFPNICAVCGFPLSTGEHAICVQCLENKFETADYRRTRASATVMLPEGVYMQHAIWTFDTGSQIQMLMHQLKYNGITGIGIDAGRFLGISLMNNPYFNEKYIPDDMILLPVPLHAKKRKKRGYNQSYYIAKGIAEVTDVKIVDEDSVLRIRHTKTQTGFSLEERRKNIDNAFYVIRPELFRDKTCIIVDDVFTTGATTFELASELISYGLSDIIIATIAQA